MKSLKKVELAFKRWWKPLLAGLFGNRPHDGVIDPTKVRKILILRLDRFGDMVVSTPLFRSLKKRLPDVELGVFGGPDNTSILERDPNITRVFRRQKNAWATWKEARRARREGYDVVLNLNLNPSLTGALIANVAAPGAIKVMGSADPSTRAFYNMSLGIRRDLRTPMVDLVLRFLEAFGWGGVGEDRSSYLTLEGVPREKVDAFLAERIGSAGGFVALNPFAGDGRRDLGPDLAASVARGLNEQTGLPVVILWAPGREREVSAVVDRCGDSNIIAGLGPVSILETALLLEKARFVVSPDTSIVHIADAVGRPVVVIYSELVPSYREWFPRSVPYKKLSADGEIRELDAREVLERSAQLYRELKGSEPNAHFV